VLYFECVENADVQVEFNLTVMRNALQGKVYNIAFNLEALARQGLSDCRLRYGATAVEVGGGIIDGTGALADPKGVYPGIVFGGETGIAMTSGTGALCFAHGLNKEGSPVKTTYIQGARYAGSNAASFRATFRSDGRQAERFAGSQDPGSGGEGPPATPGDNSAGDPFAE